MFLKIVTTYTLILSLIISCFLPYSIAQESSYTFAVLDLDANGVSNEEARSLSNELRTYITQLVASPEMIEKSSVSYTVLERTQMDKIFDEFDLQNTGCTDISCAIEFGKMLNVQGIIIGSVGLVGETYTLNISLVDIETSVTLKGASYKVRGERDNLLNEGIPEVARSIFELGKKFPWKRTLYISAAIIGAGIIYFASLPPEEETMGDIVIEIPSPQE